MTQQLGSQSVEVHPQLPRIVGDDHYGIAAVGAAGALQNLILIDHQQCYHQQKARCHELNADQKCRHKTWTGANRARAQRLHRAHAGEYDCRESSAYDAHTCQQQYYEQPQRGICK